MHSLRACIDIILAWVILKPLKVCGILMAINDSEDADIHSIKVRVVVAKAELESGLSPSK